MTIADLQTYIRYLTGTDSTSLTDANLLIFINQEYERIVGKLISETAGAIWQFGDSNYTAFPTYTMDLVNSQAEYQIDSLTTPLTIFAVEILDNSGIWRPINPISFEDIRKQRIAQVEYLKTDGQPFEYEKREHIVVLYPAPDNGVSVTLTGGLKIFFLRTADIYTSTQVTTGTKVPGFPSPWHDAIVYAVAYIYAITNGLPNALALKADRNEKFKELLSFISRRDQDDQHIMTNKPISFI